MQPSTNICTPTACRTCWQVQPGSGLPDSLAGLQNSEGSQPAQAPVTLAQLAGCMHTNPACNVWHDERHGMNQPHMLIMKEDRSSTHTNTQIQARTHSSQSIVSGMVRKHTQADEKMAGWMDGWKDAEIDSSPVCLLPFSPPLSAHYPG